ncbi:MAG: hypothetical protein ACKOAH_22805, partial [Pirellula sp.]
EDPFDQLEMYYNADERLSVGGYLKPGTEQYSVIPPFDLIYIKYWYGENGAIWYLRESFVQ